MLSRLFARSLSLQFKTLTLILSSSSHCFPSLSSLSSSPRFSFLAPSPQPSLLLQSLRLFSSKGNEDDGDGSWTFSPEPENVFGKEERSLAGIAEDSEIPSEPRRSEVKGVDPWLEEPKGDIFEGIDKELRPGAAAGGGDDGWETAEGYNPWSLGGGDDDDEKGNVFGIGDEGIDALEGIGGGEEKSEEMMELEMKERELLATLKGPNRAFGDLIAASGITEDMIDSLILLKDVRSVPGLPPLHEIEDKAIERMNATSSRAEIE